MGKVKNWTVEKKDEIERILINMWATLGMDIPSNYEDIVQDCYEDVCETADPENWHGGDVAIAFRRWIEKQATEPDENVQPDDYFKVIHTGFCKDSQREEIQIHAGENGNIFIFQDDDKLGFIIDVYGQEDHHDTMAVWEEDLADEDDV